MKNISKQQKCYDEFCEYYLDTIINNEDIKNELFDFSKYKVESDIIYLDINSVKINYRTIYIVLERLCIIINDENNRKIVNNYKLAELLLNRPLKKISQKQFDLHQRNKKIKGEKAETYVMMSELKKLKKLNLRPYQASIDNINLGYDIESYNMDRVKIYIEVKAIDLNSKIYWTENEVNKSKILKDNYFLYCVEFKKGEPRKIYKIIQNPYKEVLNENKFKYTIETKTTYIVGID